MVISHFMTLLTMLVVIFSSLPGKNGEQLDTTGGLILYYYNDR